METIEEPPVQITAAEGVKVNTVIGEISAEDGTLVQSDECQKSNGVADSQNGEDQPLIEESVVSDHLQPSDELINEEKITAANDTHPEPPIGNTEISATDAIVEEPLNEDAKQDEPPINDESEGLKPGDVEVDGIIEATTENILFETEILVESNVDEPASTYKIIYSDNDETDNANNILCELGQNIELSEVLRSDVTENVENNNSDVRQEVFNKEELLDILEGNDAEESRKVISQNFQTESKKFETELALRQLSRLKNTRKAKTRKTDKKSIRKSQTPKHETDKKLQRVTTIKNNKTSINVDHQTENSQETVEKKDESIVNALVKDWEDDDGGENDQPNKPKEASDLLQETNETQQNSTVEAKEAEAGDVNTPNSIAQNTDSQPQRRLGRVIKKKVIFDPDNPDTFTKTKVSIKKENSSEKEPSIQKKIKVDPTSPSKSLVQTKLQWKKPQLKNNRKYSRPTEIDKLLGDEGAVNMICQLTPEAPKGHKNMKSKAEFIKKIQSSTPNSKEMKFRERKKELKTEDGEARKIVGFKDRLSLSSLVKSPAASEDFEAHSADDSIIYRRHSSSSYSSSCMSPRRLSDVESINQSAISAQNLTPQNQSQDASAVVTDVFMSENENKPQTGIINKNNLLSIKEKLNSKLSLALNKRKRESSKGEKPPKVKKVPKLGEKLEDFHIEDIHKGYNYLTLKKGMKLAEICILNSGAVYNIEVIKELITALEYADNNEDVSVTLLTSESGSICSGLHLKPLLDQQTGSTYGRELAESVRSLLCTMMAHNKLICSVVGDKCQGLGLSMIALSDITLASESASFELSPNKNNPLQPCAALITGSMPPYLLRDVLVFERCISAAEAVRGGLASRTVWPDNYLDHARTIAKDIAAQPKQNVLLKKQLLRLQRGASGSFLAALEKERDLFVNYWTSAEGREIVRASLPEA